MANPTRRFPPKGDPPPEPSPSEPRKKTLRRATAGYEKPPSRMRIETAVLLILLAITAAGAASLYITGCIPLPWRLEGPPPPPAPETPAPPPPVAEEERKPEPPPPPAPPPTARANAPENDDMRQLYEAAAAFERKNTDQPERCRELYREVLVKYPATSWAKMAEDRYHAIADAIYASLETEYEGIQREERLLSVAGRTTEAIAFLEKYAGAQKNPVFRRRAELRIAALENESREAYNKAVKKAEEHARSGRYDQAIPLFESLRKGAIPPVAAKCDETIVQLQACRKDYLDYLEVKKREAAEQAVREKVAPKVLPLVRARRYAEALREFDAARGSAYAPAKDSVERERAALAEAALFWDAFLKTLRGRLNQDVSLVLPDGARAAGRLVQVAPDRAVVKSGTGDIDVPFPRIEPDQVVAWAIGRGLPAGTGDTCLKAALFFFFDGRDDLAGLYFATAREKGARIDGFERVFRDGFLRAAAP